MGDLTAEQLERVHLLSVVSEVPAGERFSGLAMVP